jgi:hypothetical protein
LIFVSPLYPNQLRKIAQSISRVGAAIAEAFRKGIYVIIESFRNLATYLHYLFSRWGYLMWSIFSVSFTLGLSILTYPFFSELIFMSPTTLLYPIPSFSIPITILGLLLFTIAIIRRKVKRTFGSISVMITLAGLGLTGTVALIDYGFLLIAISGSIVSVCVFGILLQRMKNFDRMWFTRLWIPIPLSLVPLFLQLSFQYEGNTILQYFTIVLSLLPVFCLYMISTKYEWIPSSYQNPLWMSIAIISGVITFVASFLGAFPILAAIYLSILVSSLISYPAISKKATQLFMGLFFFSLTGFAFSFIFTPFYQSLLPALAAALLFVSRFIREKEVETPRLVYARIIVLLILIVSLALFGISIAIMVPSL